MSMSFNAMCQGSRILNMSKKDERNLEAYFRKLEHDNGSEFILDRLKVLKNQTIRELEDPDYIFTNEDGNQSISWRNSTNSPKGPMSVIYKTWRKPESRIVGIGHLINSIQFETPTEKQIDKLVSGINSDSRDYDGKVIPIEDEVINRFVHGVNHDIKQQEVFSGLDLTGTVVPGDGGGINLKEAKNNLLSKDRDKSHKSIAKLTHALDVEWLAAPKFATDFLRKEVPAYRGLKFRKNREIQVRDYEIPVGSKWKGRVHPGDPFAGSVAMLQKPGGKLRTVFNTNRVLNKATEPYARGLEHAFYDNYPHEIFVLRQDKGMKSVQNMIKRGHTLVSADLSSATDYLNPRPLYNGLRVGIIRNMDDPTLKVKIGAWNLEDESKRGSSIDVVDEELSRLDKSPHITDHDRKAILALKSISVFEKASQLPFLHPESGITIAERSGQPLGMMGSFQTLTAMNFLAGKMACEQSHGRFDKEIPQFATVGDDFVGDESIMDSYSSIIKSWGGKDNSEKAMHSNKYAEFLSHLITRDKIIAMKPKFVPGRNNAILNADKTSVNRLKSVYKLSTVDRNSIEILSRLGDPSLSFMGVPAGSHRASLSFRMDVENILKTISLLKSDVPDTVSFSETTSNLARMESDVDSQYEGTPFDRRIYTYDSKGHKVYTGIARAGADHKDDQFTTTVDRYNHRTGERDKRLSLNQRKSQLRETALQLGKAAATLEELNADTEQESRNLDSVGKGLDQMDRELSDINKSFSQLTAEIMNSSWYKKNHVTKDEDINTETKSLKTDGESPTDDTSSNISIEDTLPYHDHTSIDKYGTVLQAYHMSEIENNEMNPKKDVMPSQKDSNHILNPVDRSRFRSKQELNPDYPVASPSTEDLTNLDVPDMAAVLDDTLKDLNDGKSDQNQL